MDSITPFLTELKPAALIVAVLLAVALVSSRFVPEAGPWVSLAALLGTGVYVAQHVRGVEERPQWLLPVAIGGAVLAALAIARVVGTIRARSHSDNTIGYLFPTAVAVLGMWMSVALINFERLPEETAALLGRLAGV